MMQAKFWPHSTKEDVAKIIDQNTLDRLRCAGFAVVPLQPSQEMIEVGAPFCFIVPYGNVETSLSDAADCYRSMIELGCL